MSSIPRENQEDAARNVAKMLRNMRNVVTEVWCILSARVPIIKFVHVKTGLSCDLSFKNQMAVMNTEFIRLCVEADSRIRILMVSIRFWALKYELSGGGKGGRMWRITNYALTLLIIFYLQVILQ
jgi:DNA polymerase sigma